MKQQELLGMLQPWQGEVIMSQAKFRVMACSRQIGKSVTLRSICYKTMLEKPNAKVLYCANTITQVREVGFVPMFGNSDDMLFPSHLIKSINQTQLSVTLINGSRIIFRGTEAVDKLRGLSGYDLIVLDEFQSMPKQVFTILQPVISANIDGKMVIAGTPKGHNHFYTAVQKGLQGSQKKQRNWRSWIVPITDVNLPNSTPEAISDAKSSMSKLAFEQEYMVSFNATQGLVYPAFDLIKNHTDLGLSKEKPIMIGLDFNVGKMCAVVGQVGQHTYARGGKSVKVEIFNVLDEIVLENTNTQEMAQEIIKRYGAKWKGRIYVYPDASGNARKTSSDSTDHLILKNHGLNVITPNKNPFISDRVNSVNAFLCNANNEQKLFIASNCRYLKDSLLSQTYDKYGKPEKKHGDDDLSGPVDALGYLIHKRYPIKNTKVKTSNVFGHKE